jgi:hypothetical protein
MKKVLSWASSVEEALRTKGVTPSAMTELFLEPREDLKSCGYYLVDHATRIEFWVDKVSTETLDIIPVVSASHLSELRRSALTDYYS